MAKIGNIELNVEGDKEIQRLADRLGRAFTVKELNQGYRFALGEVVTQMKRNVKTDHNKPGSSGNLLYSINTQSVTNLRKHKLPGMIAGPLFKNSKGARPFARHLVEYGTKAHKIVSKTGKGMPIFKGRQIVGWAKEFNHPGSKAYRPFGRAIEAKQDGAMARLRTKLGKIVDKELAKR